MKRIKHSSLGDYITTLCFFGLTILSFVKANEVLNAIYETQIEFNNIENNYDNEKSI